MKRLFLTGFVALLGVAGPLGAAVLAGAGAAPAAAATTAKTTSAPHVTLLGRHVLPDLGRHLTGLSKFDSSTTSTSTNWSGYAATGNTYQDISSTWVEPTVTCSSGGGGLLGLGGAPTAYSSFWVGLDGYTSTSVEQTGTDSDCDSGTPTYYAWYEMYPAASVDLPSSDAVSPGDTMSGSVTSNAGATSFILALKDVTKGWSFSVTESSGSTSYARSSAEWVAEAPSECDVLFCSVTSLADFGSVSFTNATASTTANPTSSLPISSFPNTAITMASSSGTTEATPSGLSSSGNAFSVKWDAS
jgi:hypothetical protein